jgi:hypothetical protein
MDNQFSMTKMTIDGFKQKAFAVYEKDSFSNFTTQERIMYLIAELIVEDCYTTPSDEDLLSAIEFLRKKFEKI